MVTKKQDKPKRKPNNPTGKNQYAAGKGLGEKNDSFLLRLSSKDKQKFKKAANKKEMNLTNWLISVASEAAES
ncbi:hypothetical protein [Hyella patelloides]|uniref:hypothetical protein n=1 Tax=Hyella patelloides TaxID=1982969 RepID=UPI0011AAEB07|nr:hypothetical protein [Hyella patelloides]